jgi:hypothetical protein
MGDTCKDILSVLQNSGSEFCKHFNENINKVFAHPKEEIIDVLLKADDYMLSLLRIKLFANIVQMIPELKKYDLKTRRKRENTSDDIFILGHSLVNKSENKNLRRILKLDSEYASELGTEDTNDQIDRDELVTQETCLELKSSVIEMRQEMKGIKSRTSDMVSKLTATKLTVSQYVEGEKQQANNKMITQVTEPELSVDSNFQNLPKSENRTPYPM